MFVLVAQCPILEAGGARSDCEAYESVVAATPPSVGPWVVHFRVFVWGYVG